MSSGFGTLRWGRGGVAAFVVVALGVSAYPMGSPWAESSVEPLMLECTIVGTPRADALSGSAGVDVICGLGGDDVLRGLGGHDVLLGGGGDDVLIGGGGNDFLRGAAGADVVVGGASADRLRGWGGADRLLGGAGRDNLRGGVGSDVMRGGPGRDLVSYVGVATAVRVSIGDGANDGGRREGDRIARDVEDLRGGSGNDTLIGSPGANRLFSDGGK